MTNRLKKLSLLGGESLMLKSNRTQEKAKREARKKALNPERTPRNCRGTVEGTGDEQVEAVTKR